MKYIIMCGGNYPKWEQLRHLSRILGEPIVHRTIRLLREYGVKDIAISSNHADFEKFGVPVLTHENNYGNGGYWTEAFYPTNEPTCYIFGDVVFSKAAIKTIVETNTNSIEFFASAPPFSPRYPKRWAEPFAFKVQNQQYFRVCIDKAEELYREKKLKRLISWELWQVIKGTPLNDIDYTNYTTINDYTCDVDKPEDLEKIERVML